MGGPPTELGSRLYYIYAIDRDFGLFFLKFCSYFPYNAKLCLNGHEYLKRQLTQEGIAFEALDNGLLTCADPVRAQTICDELSAPRIYSPRQAAYDLKKLRAKGLLEKVPGTRRYHLPPIGVRTLAALLVLHAQVIKPLLAGIGKPKMGRRPKPKTWTRIDAHYEALRKQMQALFDDLGLAAA